MMKQFAKSSLLALLVVSFVLALSPPGSVEAGIHDADGEVTYKEYWVSHSEFTGGCGDDERPSGGTWYLEPWPCTKTLEFEIPDDFSQALKVEIYLDLWRNRVGHSARFSLNGGPTHAPDVGYDWSRTPYIGEVPKSELQQGTNTITLWHAAGGYHVHDIAFRIYHDAAHPLLPGPGSDVTPPDGELTSIVASNGSFQPAPGGILQVNNDQLTLNATASEASYVEFHGFYYGYDEDNDGQFLDWHNLGRNNLNPGPDGTIDHIGTDTSAPYSVTWNLPHITNQSGVKFKIRVVDGAGNVREAAGGVSGAFSLTRNFPIETYLNPDFRDGVLHHDGAYPDTGTWYVNLPVDLSDVTGAYLVGAFWRNPRISINDNASFYAFPTGEDYWTLSIRGVPPAHLQPGPNKITYIHISGFGEFIEEPGPMIVLRRSSPSDTYTLTATTVGGGTVAMSPDQASYSYGQGVTLTANPDPGWSFAGWSGDLSGAGNPATIIMDGDKTVTATFTQDEYTLSVTVVGNGSVSVVPLQATYHYGEQVTLTASPDPDWSFVRWSGDLSGISNPATMTMDGDKNVTATFTTGSEVEWRVFLPQIIRDAEPGSLNLGPMP